MNNIQKAKQAVEKAMMDVLRDFPEDLFGMYIIEAADFELHEAGVEHRGPMAVGEHQKRCNNYEVVALLMDGTGICCDRNTRAVWDLEPQDDGL